jgi:hypothetical protein
VRVGDHVVVVGNGGYAAIAHVDTLDFKPLSLPGKPSLWTVTVSGDQLMMAGENGAWLTAPCAHAPGIEDVAFMDVPTVVDGDYVEDASEEDESDEDDSNEDDSDEDESEEDESEEDESEEDESEEEEEEEDDF